MRRLAGLERQFYQQNLVGSTNIVSAMVFNGRLDDERLQSALRLLIKAYPVLDRAIVADPYIRFSTSQQDSLPFAESSASDWRHELGLELARQYPDQQIFLKHLSGEQSVLLLGLNHAIADGLSALTLSRDLLHLYRGDAVTPLPHGEGIESRLPRPYRGLRGWWKALRFIFALAKLGPALQIGSLAPTKHTASLGFHFDDAERLNAWARQQGANFFALVSAIVLESLYELYGETSGAQSLSLNTPVSLRGVAGVPEREIGVFIAGQLALYQVNAETDTIGLARTCYESLRRDIGAGHPFHLARLARGASRPKPPKPPKQHSTHRPTVSISNLGRIEPLPYGNGLPEVAEIHAVSAQSLKDPFAFVLSSYGGRTAIDLQYSEEKIRREEAEAMLAAVRQKLAIFAEKIPSSQGR